MYNLAGINRKQMKGIIGKKIGMTSIFDPAGKQTSCTIIEAGPCVVTHVRTKDSDGYNALQLAFGGVPSLLAVVVVVLALVAAGVGPL